MWRDEGVALQSHGWDPMGLDANPRHLPQHPFRPWSIITWNPSAMSPSPWRRQLWGPAMEGGKCLTSHRRGGMGDCRRSELVCQQWFLLNTHSCPLPHALQGAARYSSATSTAISTQKLPASEEMNKNPLEVGDESVSRINVSCRSLGMRVRSPKGRDLGPETAILKATDSLIMLVWE